MRVRASIAVLAAASVVGASCTPLRPLDGVLDGGASIPDARALDATADAPSRDAPASADAAHDAPRPDIGAVDAYGAPDALASPDAFRAPDAWSSPTPIRPSVPGSLVISELMIAPFGGAENEWIEIYNPSAEQRYELAGCRLDGTTSMHVIGGSLEVEPRQYATAAVGKSVAFAPDYEYGRALQLSEPSDRVALVCDGVVIDEVRYDGRFPVLAQRSIMVASEVLGGASPHTGNDVASAWCSAPDTALYAPRAYGTPGALNRCPPRI